MLQFDNEAARKLETIYSSPDFVAQRSATLERLRLRPGEEVIDVGCGPGFLCEQMADCVGPTGRLPRSEPLPATLGLANAASQERILYTSTDGVDGKSPITVSGALFIPKGTPPQEGWPLLAWAHGTVGIADICSPSWQARSYRDVRYLNEWLSQGFAIVATDYQGLGTPGPHPYLKVRPEAYSVLDSVRAVLTDVPGLANKIVIVGQSQGGGATFATAAFAPDY